MRNHPAHQINDLVRSGLPSLIEGWQRVHPASLLPTSWVTSQSASDLGVSSVVIRKHLTDAVADGVLIEILVRRDWRVMLPCEKSLYAVPDGELYQLVLQRPVSRGSNGVSFLTTSKGYGMLLNRVNRKFRASG